MRVPVAIHVAVIVIAASYIILIMLLRRSGRSNQRWVNVVSIGVITTLGFYLVLRILEWIAR